MVLFSHTVAAQATNSGNPPAARAVYLQLANFAMLMYVSAYVSGPVLQSTVRAVACQWVFPVTSSAQQRSMTAPCKGFRQTPSHQGIGLELTCVQVADFLADRGSLLAAGTSLASLLLHDSTLHPQRVGEVSI